VNQGAILIATYGGGDFFMGKDKTDMDTKTHGGEAAEAGHSSRFYQNRKCEYFPCHELDAEALNCLFCYCPLYHTECPGEVRIVKMGDREIKDCSRCDFPHRPEHYDTIVEHLMAMLFVRS